VSRSGGVDLAEDPRHLSPSVRADVQHLRSFSPPGFRPRTRS